MGKDPFKNGNILTLLIYEIKEMCIRDRVNDCQRAGSVIASVNSPGSEQGNPGVPRDLPDADLGNPSPSRT